MVAVISGGAGTGQGLDEAVGEDLADALSAGVGDEEVPEAIECDSRRLIEDGVVGGAAVANGVEVAIAGNCVDVLSRVDLADADAIGDVEVA